MMPVEQLHEMIDAAKTTAVSSEQQSERSKTPLLEVLWQHDCNDFKNIMTASRQESVNCVLERRAQHLWKSD